MRQINSMSSHEKHQYFYEKYIRNEMTDKERRAFEEKLSADESFRVSFLHYKLNRSEYLEELVTDNKIKQKKSWNLNSMLYLFISITGIALAFNYYIFKENEIPTTHKPENKNWNIYNLIPFLSNRNDNVKHERPKNIRREKDSTKDEILADTTAIDTENNSETTIPESQNEGIANDIMELDSFVVAYEKNFFEHRYKAIKNETDSMIVDSLMDMLAAKSAGRNTQQSKPLMIYVEFWRSPINFRGYKFNGKKLMIYGIPSPYEIFLLKDNEDIILRTNRSEATIIKDNEFHKF